MSAPCVAVEPSGNPGIRLAQYAILDLQKPHQTAAPLPGTGPLFVLLLVLQEASQDQVTVTRMAMASGMTLPSVRSQGAASGHLRSLSGPRCSG